MDGKDFLARAERAFAALKPSVRAVPSEPQKRVKSWKLAEAILRPAPRLPPDEWARANRVYPETSGLPGPRDPSITPYIVPVERAIHAGTHKRVVMVCGAQMGKSLSLDTMQNPSTPSLCRMSIASMISAESVAFLPVV